MTVNLQINKSLWRLPTLISVISTRFATPVAQLNSQNLRKSTAI